MATVEYPAKVVVYGWQCWFCAKKWAAKGETPTRWRETTCAALGKGECEVEHRFWNPRKRRDGV
jgi:hypothetical protein